MFVCANTRYKLPLEIQFLYLGQWEIYAFSRHAAYLFYLSKIAVYFIYLSSYVPNKCSPFSQAMCQFKYQSGHLKVTVWQLRATDNKYLHCYNIQLVGIE